MINMETTQVLFKIDITNSDDVVDAAAWIIKHGDVYEVQWTDFVANDWSEKYVTMGAALARIALLADCGASDWTTSFKSDDALWEHDWAAFSTSHRA